MSVARRGRSLSVLGFLLPGGIGLISATQTWLTVQRADAPDPLLVPGAEALPLLTALSLAVLALGAALSIAGLVVRYLFAAAGLAAAGLLLVSTVRLALDPPLSAVAPAVTEATGLAGDAALHDIVSSVAPTPWPVVALVCWAVLLTASLFAAVTARGWRTGGRRYSTSPDASARPTGPLDPVDSWDDLSHGADPTDRPR